MTQCKFMESGGECKARAGVSLGVGEEATKRRKSNELKTNLVVLHRYRCDPYIVGPSVLQRLDHVLEDAELWREQLARS